MGTMWVERLGGGAAVLPNLDDDAMGVARMQEGLLPVRIGQVDPEVVRARAAAGEEAAEESPAGAPGGVSSSIFGGLRS